MIASCILSQVTVALTHNSAGQKRVGAWSANFDTRRPAVVAKVLSADVVGGCVRREVEPCFEQSHPYYQVSTRGINPMMERFLQEAELLVRDANADIDATSSRLDYMWQVRAPPAGGVKLFS